MVFLSLYIAILGIKYYFCGFFCLINPITSLKPYGKKSIVFIDLFLLFYRSSI
jgi:hypothetical protein